MAFQLRMIQRESLIDAIERVAKEDSRPLKDLLVERGKLSPQCTRLLTDLVQEHIAQHDGDADKSLRTLLPSEIERKAILQSAKIPETPTLSGREETNAHPSLAEQTVANPTAPSDFVATDSGSTANRFKKLRPHAKGGLGKVSVALDREFGREVALKEIQERYAQSDSSRKRFTLEAEVTGGLEHPGIVPVYGMGKDSRGRPFYAMRFVRGRSLKQEIDRFHDPVFAQHRREIAHRLELRSLLGRLIDVCNAIEYAHSRGVLHRDIKPGNIMLGKFGETLVVDWGLAKFIGRDSTPEPSGDQPELSGKRSSESASTRMGAAVGTPAFMSPEQAAGRIDQLGPASDVYSLGATLYAILTGCNPFNSLDPADDLLEAVRRGEFTKPTEHTRGIPKALESICLKAMQTEPRRRYVSPTALAADIEHWLADEPVNAHRESFSEQLGRWERKHRSNLRAGSLALAFVATAAILAAISINGARRQEARQRVRADQNAAHERLAAEAARQAERKAQSNLTRALEAEQQAGLALQKATEVATSSAEVSDFLANLFLGSDPNGLGGGVTMVSAKSKDISAVELLKVGAQSLDRHMKSKDEVRAKLTGTLGFIFSAFAEYKTAKPLIDESLELHRNLYSDDAPELAECLKHAGVLYHFLGDYRTARKHVRESMKICEQQYDSQSLELAEIMFLVGWYIGGEGTNPTLLAESEQLLRQAIKIQQAQCKSGDEQVFISQMALADILHQQHRDQEALILVVRTSNGFSVTRNDPRPRELADVMLSGFNPSGDLTWQEIIDDLTNAHQQSTESFGKHHPFVRFLEAQIGTCIEASGDVAQGEAYWRSLVDAESKSFADGPWVARRLEELANFLVRHQRYADAEASFLEALRIRRITVGQNSIYAGRVLNSLAMVAFRQDQLGPAQQWINQSLAAYDASTEDHPETVKLWRDLAVENRDLIEANSDPETAR